MWFIKNGIFQAFYIELKRRVSEINNICILVAMAFNVDLQVLRIIALYLPYRA